MEQNWSPTEFHIELYTFALVFELVCAVQEEVCPEIPTQTLDGGSAQEMHDRPGEGEEQIVLLFRQTEEFFFSWNR